MKNLISSNSFAKHLASSRGGYSHKTTASTQPPTSVADRLLIGCSSVADRFLTMTSLCHRLVAAILLLFTLSIGNVLGANTPASAGEYSLVGKKPGGENKFYKLGDGVYIHRKSNSSWDSSMGMKIPSTNDNGVAVYLSSSMKVSALINKKSDKNAVNVELKAYPITNGSTTFTALEAGTDNSTTVSVTIGSTASYTLSTSFAALSSKAAENKSTNEVTFAAGYYYIVGTDNAGTTYLTSVTLTAAAATAPSITAPAADQSAEYTVGDEITALSITASGSPAPTYQWYYNSSASTEGATSLGSTAQTASYTPSNTAASNLYYYCVATNSAGSATSHYFHVTVNASSCTDVAAPTSLAENTAVRTTEKVTFTWTKATNASSYTATLYSDAECTAEVESKDLGDVATVYFDGLTDETTYYCKVQSHGDGSTYCANGGSTDAVSGTTATIPSYNVTAETSTGDNLRGTVSAAASSVKMGQTTLITAVPAAGYRVSAWAHTGTGASIDPAGPSNSLTTTLTMGTGDVTVTVSFEEIPTSTITLDPNGGTISDATGWTLTAGKYEKTVAQNTEVALPTFTNAGHVFMTWRQGAVDKTSPVTVSDDIELKAIWGTEEEVTIYSWESPSGTAIEEGGTATHYNGSDAVAGNTRVNYANKPINGDTETEYYTISLNGSADYSSDHIRIALDQNIKAGDEVKMTAYYTKNSDKSAAAKMNTQDGTKIFEGSNLPNLYGGGSPVLQTYTVPAGINTDAIKMTRYQTGSGTFITKLVITGTRIIEDMDPAATPSITGQPESGIYNWDAAPTLTVTASVTDGGTLSYQWYKKGDTDTKVGTNSSSYTPSVTGVYYVVVTNTKTGYAKATATSSDADITILPRPSYKVTYYDGGLKLGEETVYEDESPTHAGDFDDMPMATFQGWFYDSDLQYDVPDITAEVITGDAEYYSKWNKTYASNVDFVQFIADNTTSGDYATYLSTNGYLLTEGTGNANALDNSNAFDTGLKLKSSNDNKLQFNVEAGKIIKLTVGRINGMSIAINGAAATSIPSGSDATHLGVSYYYSVNTQAVTITETSTSYNMLKVIEFLDPMTVTYDATTNGGSCETADATFTGTALTLPEATKAGWQFDGWFTTANDDSETGVLVGEAGDAYTPSADITLFARFTETTTLATLTDIKVNGSTLADFAVDKFEYNIVLPYKTADVPTVAYTKGYSGAIVTMSPDPISSVFGDVTLHVVSQDGSNENDYVIHVIEGEKDMLCLVWVDVTGQNSYVVDADKSFYTATPSAGNIKNTSSYGGKTGYKFNSSDGSYLGLTDVNFKSGDIVEAFVTTVVADKMRAFKANTATDANKVAEGASNMIQGANRVALTENVSALYLRRGNDYSDWNPYVAYVAVYRAYPTPVLSAITIDGASGSITGTAVSVTVPKNADLANLTIVPTFLSNDPANTSGARQGGNTWVEGENTYRVTDKDGDYTDYTITLAKDVAIESVTISGETSVMAKSQITLTATVLPAAAANKDVTWSSSDETKATVDANGVVTGKAAGNVTITATSVADGTISDTHDITVTKFVGTEYAYWFAKAADATTNGVTNDDGTIFEGAPTDGSNLSSSLTMEVNGVETTYTVTRRTGDSDFGTFHVPTDFTANLYMLVIGSGSPRTLTLKETSTNAEYSSNPATFGDQATQILFANIPSGNYSFDKHNQSIRLAVMVAELNSYPLTGVAIEDGFNLRLGNSRTPVITPNPAKAAIASQTWTEVSRTGASDATFSTSTGAITAGTEEGTITVKVTVTDNFGNEVESNNCVVNIVNVIDQQSVTGSVIWNWSGAAGSSNITINDPEVLALANYINGDEWAKIKGSNGDQAYHYESSYQCYQGTGTLSFTTTVPGLVTITARRSSNGPALKIGNQAIMTLTSSTQISTPFFVPAGEVNIVADATDGARILKIEFDADLTPDKVEGSFFGGYTRDISVGRYGSICLPKAGFMVGAALLQVSYRDMSTTKIYFDQVISGQMESGRPYLFIRTDEANQLCVFYTTEDASSEPVYNNDGLVGTFVAIPDLYDHVGSTSGYGFLQNNRYYDVVDGSVSAAANRAYFKYADIYTTGVAPQPAPGCRRFAAPLDGTHKTPTGLEDVLSGNEKMQKMLIDGKLFIIREGRVYDATGQLIK